MHTRLGLSLSQPTVLRALGVAKPHPQAIQGSLGMRLDIAPIYRLVTL